MWAYIIPPTVVVTVWKSVVDNPRHIDTVATNHIHNPCAGAGQSIKKCPVDSFSEWDRRRVGIIRAVYFHTVVTITRCAKSPDFVQITRLQRNNTL